MNLQKIALIVLIIGGLDMGIFGLLNFEIISAILGAGSLLAHLIYIVVGVAAGYLGAVNFVFTESSNNPSA